MATSNARFQTIVDGTCEMRDCHHASGWVAIVTGRYGEDGLAAYCDAHAEALEDSATHTFIGGCEPITDAAEQD